MSIVCNKPVSPYVLWGEICSFLSVKDMCNAKRICKEIHKAMSDPNHIYHIDPFSNVSERLPLLPMLRNVKTFTSISEVNFSLLLSKVPNVERIALQLWQDFSNVSGLQNLAKLHMLSAQQFSEEYRDTSLVLLQHAPESLKILQLVGNNMPAGAWEQIGNLHQLTTFVANVTVPNIQQMHYLRNCQNLNKFCVYTGGETAYVISLLNSWPKLTDLALWGEFTESDINGIAKACPNLESLILETYRAFSSDQLTQLQQMSNLTYLSLPIADDSQCVERLLEYVGSNKNLLTLRVKGLNKSNFDDLCKRVEQAKKEQKANAHLCVKAFKCNFIDYNLGDLGRLTYEFPFRG